MKEKHYKKGLLVGRFQPVHKGHRWLILHALSKVDMLIIGIGSANLCDEANPFTYQERSKMIQEMICHEKLKGKILSTLPLNDYFDDELWFDNAIQEIKKSGNDNVDVIIGNNEWVNGIFEKRGYEIMRVGYYKRYIFEGEKIRKLMRENNEWKNRVPSYITPLIEAFNDKKLPFKFIYGALGGTFDHFHIGHEKLLDTAFDNCKFVSVGITKNELSGSKLLSISIEDYKARKESVNNYLDKKGYADRARIFPLSDMYGTTKSDGTLEAIVVSKETYDNALKINSFRKKNNLPQLSIIIIPYVLSDDKKIMTSERIRKGVVDRRGTSYSIFDSGYPEKKQLYLPEYLRKELRKPLGEVVYGHERELIETANKIVKSINLAVTPMVVAVGDVVVQSLLDVGFDPDVKIIDYKTRRQNIRGFHNMGKGHIFDNPAGTINISTALVIRKKIYSSLLKKERQWIIVDGEEDLLTLPAIIFAPLNSVVLYGQIDIGAIKVLVTEEKKQSVNQLLKKFII